MDAIIMTLSCVADKYEAAASVCSEPEMKVHYSETAQRLREAICIITGEGL